MPDETPATPVGVLLRQAGYDLPAADLPDLDHAHALLQAMLARLGTPAPDEEPAPIFQAGPRA
jgi:hypothetical protein